MIAGITLKPTSLAGGLFRVYKVYLGFDLEGAESTRMRMQDVEAPFDQSTAVVWYVAAALIVDLVNDGWSGRPSPLMHQMLLLPFTITLSFVLVRLLARREAGQSARVAAELGSLLLVVTCVFFEVVSTATFAYERHHFSRFGYAFHPAVIAVASAAVFVAALMLLWRRSDVSALVATTTAYAAGLLLAIRCFPLNYLRSDMLPVILWADSRVFRQLNPYVTMHIGSRLYDFPYLPGMLVVFLPAVALHGDLRFVELICVLTLSGLIYWTASPGSKGVAVGVLGTFVLSPFLQYRHDLYLAPHWLALIGAFAFFQRGRLAWGSIVFGTSMGIYQLSWVLFPFLVLYAFRRGGWREAVKIALLSFGSMLLIMGPFLASAMRQIASNTVGQWSRLPHALADPINLSYWLTFLIRPEQLKWVQLAVMSAIFSFCVVRDRCRTLTDTARWMSAALALFIALNVIVDGYFYLTLLVLLLTYTLLASGAWTEPEARALA